MAGFAPRFVVRLSPSRFAGVSEGAKGQSGFQGIKGTNLKGVRTWRIRNLPYRATWRFNMKMVKSLILGSATALVAMSGAQAADLPVKAKAVEYVRICSLYGAGFYYIPGTDTCIKIGAYLRAEVNVHGATNTQPFLAGDPAVNTRYQNNYNDYARMAVTIDTRTATEYGVVRTFGQIDETFATEGVGNSINIQSSLNTASLQGQALSNYAGTGYSGLEFAFVQWAGFTLGKSASAFNTPWHGYPGNNTSFL